MTMTSWYADTDYHNHDDDDNLTRFNNIQALHHAAISVAKLGM